MLLISLVERLSSFVFSFKLEQDKHEFNICEWFYNPYSGFLGEHLEGRGWEMLNLDEVCWIEWNNIF